MSKGQLDCDIIFSCKNTFLAVIQCQKGDYESETDLAMLILVARCWIHSRYAVYNMSLDRQGCKLQPQLFAD